VRFWTAFTVEIRFNQKVENGFGIAQKYLLPLPSDRALTALAVDLKSGEKKWPLPKLKSVRTLFVRA
jgi:hypothetical protein